MTGGGLWRREAVSRGVVGPAVLAGVVTAVVKLWLPAIIAAGVAAGAAAVSGLWAARGVHLLTARVDREREVGRSLKLDSRGRLPRVAECGDPVLLGVHPAAALGPGGDGSRTTPFIVRDVTARLHEAIRRDRFVLIVGESTAGKSRALYEAMRILLPGHRLIEPVGREAVQAAVEMAQMTPRCVVWLDDLERFLGPGGLTGAAVHGVLSAPGDGRFILATMRAPEHARYSGRGAPGMDRADSDGLRRGREVLNLAAHVHLPRSWSADELERAVEFRTDHRVREALEHAHRFGLAEYLAAGPQLLADWRDAWAPGTHPRAAALVSAAVDVRRLGIHRPLDLSTLGGLHEPYLRARSAELLRPEPLDAALAWATTPLHATSSLLLPLGDQTYLAFDYLIDAIDKEPMPVEALDRLIEIATPQEAVELGFEAWRWLRLEQAERAFVRAEAAGNAEAADARCGVIAERIGVGASVQFARDAANRMLKKFGPHHPEVLRARLRLGRQLGEAGDARAALGYMTWLTPLAVQLFGEEAREALELKCARAYWTGRAGDPAAAAALYAELIDVHARVFGARDELVYDCRDEHAHCVGKSGDLASAVRLLRDLVEDMEQAEAPRRDVASVRWRLAQWMTDAGDHEAQELWHRIVAEQEALNGRFHIVTLNAREALAECIGHAGDPSSAARMLHDIAAEVERLGGADSYDTLDTRRVLAEWTGWAGEPGDAVGMLRELVSIGERKFGTSDIVTLTLRRRLAYWTWENDHVADAIAILEQVIADSRHARVRNHALITECHTQLEAWQRTH